MTKFDDLILETVDDVTLENFRKVTEKFIDVNPLDVHHEMVRQSSLYAYYAGLKADCKKLLDTATLNLETFVAESRNQYKETEKQKGNKVTEKTIDSHVQALPMYKDLTQQVIDLEYKVSLMKGIENALNQRKDILVQLSANARKEMGLF